METFDTAAPRREALGIWGPGLTLVMSRVLVAGGLVVLTELLRRAVETESSRAITDLVDALGGVGVVTLLVLVLMLAAQAAAALWHETLDHLEGDVGQWTLLRRASWILPVVAGSLLLYVAGSDNSGLGTATPLTIFTAFAVVALVAAPFVRLSSSLAPAGPASLVVWLWPLSEIVAVWQVWIAWTAEPLDSASPSSAWVAARDHMLIGSVAYVAGTLIALASVELSVRAALTPEAEQVFMPASGSALPT